MGISHCTYALGTVAGIGLPQGSNEEHLVRAIRGGRRRGFVRNCWVIATLVVIYAAAYDVRATVPACETRAARVHQVLRARSMANWEPLDNRTVLIWTKDSARAHLVRLDRALAGLIDAPMIYLVDADGDGRISACGRDGIVIRDGRDVTQGARIVSIELLSARRTADLDPGGHETEGNELRI